MLGPGVIIASFALGEQGAISSLRFAVGRVRLIGDGGLLVMVLDGVASVVMGSGTVRILAFGLVAYPTP